MTTPVFPALAGQGFSVHKKPVMSTIVASHVSGREVRTQLYQNPIWQFEVPLNGLDGTVNGQYGALGAQSMQALLGLFLQCGGQFGTFVYYDPTDYAVSGQTFGIGDGTTKSFQLTRTIGGFTEAVVAPFTPSAVTTLAFPGGPIYPAMNLLTNSDLASSAGLTLYDLTAAGSQTDAFGGSNAVLIADTTATGYHFAYATATIPAGACATGSIYLKLGGSRYWHVRIWDVGSGSNQVLYADFDLTAGAITATGTLNSATGPYTASMTSVGSGWYRCSVSGVLDATATSLRLALYDLDGASTGTGTSYAGVTSNTVYACFPQLEIDSAPSAPGPYVPTLAAASFGGPSISVAGTYVDPSTYTLANGVVNFTTAPASAAALTWTGCFGFLCRFDDDSLDLDQFMANLWQVESLKFRSVRGS